VLENEIFNRGQTPASSDLLFLTINSGSSILRMLHKFEKSSDENESSYRELFFVLVLSRHPKYEFFLVILRLNH